MQLRCTYCQTMFAIGRDETLAALEHMAENNQKYYDSHCPKCRRANRVEGFKLEFSYPGWREAIQSMDKEATQSEAKQVPVKAEIKPSVAPIKPSPSQGTPTDKGKKKHTAAKKAPGKTALKIPSESTQKGKKPTGTRKK